MRSLDEHELTEAAGGQLFGKIVGAIVGGACGAVTLNIWVVISASTIGAGIGSELQDRINGEGKYKD